MYQWEKYANIYATWTQWLQTMWPVVIYTENTDIHANNNTAELD